MRRVIVFAASAIVWAVLVSNSAPALQTSGGSGPGGSSSGAGNGAGSLASPLGRHLLVILLDDAPLHASFADFAGFLDDPTSEVSTTSALYAHTPNLDALAAGGLRFLAFRTAPVCSPTRASLLTGRHAFRHGVGTVLLPNRDGPVGLGGLAEFGDGEFAAPSILQALDGAGVGTALIGKVHLSTWTDQEFAHNPGRFGSGWTILERIAAPETFLSTQLRNLNQTPVPGSPHAFDGSYYNYFSNDGVDNADLFSVTEYATSWQVDRAIEYFQTLPINQRAFCLLSFNACHSPFGRPGNPNDPSRDFPPPGLYHTQEYADDVELALQNDIDTTWPQYMASMEAIDVEVGRLLAAIPQRVRAGLSILVLGDNGIEGAMADGHRTWGKDFGPDWNSLIDDHGEARLKGSVYQWGSTTCAFWSGPGRRTIDLPTAGTATWAMIDAVDVAATVADYFGVSLAPSDGHSFLPVVYEGVEAREHARQETLAEQFWPCGDWRNIQTGDAPDEFLERGYQRWLDGSMFANGAGGRFALVRRFTGGAWHDELYRLNGEDGAPDDLFERQDLIALGGYEEQHAEMLARLEDLLDSTL